MRDGPVKVICGVWLALWASASLAGPPQTQPSMPAAQTQPREDSGADRRGDPFYITRCAMCDKERWRTGVSLSVVLDSRELRFCSEGCQRNFEQDSAANLQALDARLIDDQRPHYPLHTSVVSGIDLPAAPADVIWNNRLFRLAEQSECAALLAEPEKYLRLLDRAVIQAQSPGYGPTKCPVQGEFFDEDTITEIVIGNRMIRLCCRNCVRVVRQNPGQYLKMVDFSNREAAQKREKAQRGQPPASSPDA